MSWENELLKIMQEQGFNVETRVLEGKITSTSPLTFRPDVAADVMNARFSRAVADDAAVGDPVLAIQDMSTRRCYVIARLV